jgi:hypothetical protein
MAKHLRTSHPEAGSDGSTIVQDASLEPVTESPSSGTGEQQP